MYICRVLARGRHQAAVTVCKMPISQCPKQKSKASDCSINQQLCPFMSRCAVELHLLASSSHNSTHLHHSPLRFLHHCQPPSCQHQTEARLADGPARGCFHSRQATLPRHLLGSTSQTCTQQTNKDWKYAPRRSTQ